MIDKSPEVSNFNRLFDKLNRLSLRFADRKETLKPSTPNPKSQNHNKQIPDEAHFNVHTSQNQRAPDECFELASDRTSASTIRQGPQPSKLAPHTARQAPAPRSPAPVPMECRAACCPARETSCPETSCPPCPATSDPHNRPMPPRARRAQIRRAGHSAGPPICASVTRACRPST
jgi:hypothetical protein